MKIALFASALFVTIAAQACVDDKPVEEPVQAEAAAAPADPRDEFSISDEGKVEFKAEIVYFEFDSHTLTEEGERRLRALGDYVKTHKAQVLQIQGHCDERGSTEYNLALGELRSKAVKDYLIGYGVNEQALKTISYGEERPAAEGQGEQFWSQNRRADFVLTAAD